MVSLCVIVGLVALDTARAANDMQFTLEASKVSFAAGEPIRLTWKLLNRTTRSWLVLAGEPDCDAVTIRLATDDGRTLRQFQLSAPRTAFRPEFVELAAGSTVARSFDLRVFAEVYRITLAPGSYDVSATYSFASNGYQPQTQTIPVWRGEASTPPLRLTIRLNG